MLRMQEQTVQKIIIKHKNLYILAALLVYFWSLSIKFFPNNNERKAGI